MKLLVRMAWRNIWRNKRRTIITMSSIILAVVLSIAMRAMQLGTYRKMVHDVVTTYTGHLQIHSQGYWDDKSINKTFVLSDSLRTTLERQAELTGLIPRLESFALAAGSKRSRGALVVGIDPEAEDALTRLHKRVVDGRYLRSRDQGAMIAQGLAAFLKLGIGDTLVLLGQGYHGVNAAGAFPVVGIVDFASPELNRGFVYLNLASAQYLFSAPERLTSVVLKPKSDRHIDQQAQILDAALDAETYEVLSWREMLPELVQQIQGDNMGGLIMLGILYMIVGFGIFGTVFMMTSERMREFGIVNAVGLSRRLLALQLWAETLLLAMLSAALGTSLALPLIWYFHAKPIQLTGDAAQGMLNFGVEPILPFALDPGIFGAQALIVLAMTLVAALYPMIIVSRLEPVSAMHR